MSKFFINRPIFAFVISLLIILAGGITLTTLPISLYPDITPPTVSVTAYYPGANAEVIAETVAAPIEDKVNGVENMLYMSSASSSAGVYTLTVTFEVGTDIDMATVLVQNRVNQATSSLPSEVTRLGVTTEKKSSSILMMIGLTSDNPDLYNNTYLTNYASLNIVDELKRIEGVGSVSTFGADVYSMRMWLDPEVLRMRNLTPSDVLAAIQEQNVQVSAGKVGEMPTANSEPFQYTLNVQGRLTSIEEFGNIIVRAGETGNILRLKDVAKIELGSKTYTIDSKINHQPATSICIYQLPGANSIQVASDVNAKVAEITKNLPEGVKAEVVLDTTKFIEVSIDEVYHTLFEAFVLVIIVILLFLQDFRSTLIPAITIPVSLIGTFAVMGVMGFSINTLTLFGLILAIGIVVDDAILVVENTARHMEESGLSPYEATIKAMEEITGPIIGTVLVLLAVFVPTAFMGGITGEMYKQFAITIAVSTAFSGLNALTLSPALCSLILKPKEPGKESKFFVYKYFNKIFDKLHIGYSKVLEVFLRKSSAILATFCVILALVAFGFKKLPTAFIPTEDQGYFMIQCELQPGASLVETMDVMDKAGVILDSIPGVKAHVSISGNSVSEQAQISSKATMFVILEDWAEREDPSMSHLAIIQRFNKTAAATIENATLYAFPMPAIQGLGTSGGFELYVQDKSNQGVLELQSMAEELAANANANEELSAVRSSFKATVPQYYLNIDRDKVKLHNLSISSVFSTLSAYLGSSYANDFVLFGKVYQVRLQAESKDRSSIEDLLKLSVRNAEGKMVPFGAFVTVEQQLGTEVIARYNMYKAAYMSGNPATGYSSGQAQETFAKVAEESLGSSFGFEWTSMAFQEQMAGDSTVMIFALAIIVVLMVLAAQYESVTSPIAVIMAVPVALLGIIIACVIAGRSNDIYTQIGMVLMIALSAKNAILIVEFARDYRKEGKSIFDSSLEAGKVRLRPILMTSFAFILGVLPLVTATGAGAESRVSLGLSVFAGMLMSTLVGTFFIPNFYQFWQKIQEKFFEKKK